MVILLYLGLQFQCRTPAAGRSEGRKSKAHLLASWFEDDGLPTSKANAYERIKPPRVFGGGEASGTPADLASVGSGLVSRHGRS